MRYNLESFFSDNSTPFFTEGVDCQKGWVNVRCPFCDDASHHHGGFNLNSDNLYYSCWICGWHNSIETLKLLTGLKNPLNELKNYRITEIVEKKVIQNNTKIILPGSKEFKKVHKKYLEKRNFDIELLTEKYNLNFTTHLGDYMWRIIFPLYFEGRIVSYQGRDVTGLSDLRYKACSKDIEIIHHKEILFNIDNCKKESVILVEGIFDAIRIGDDAVCSFGTSTTEKQIQLLQKFKNVYVLFDPEIEAQKKALKIAEKLNLFGVNVELLEDDSFEDPAEMSEKDVLYLKKYLKIV